MSLLKALWSGGLIVPQYVCWLAGASCEGGQLVLNTTADGIGLAKNLTQAGSDECGRLRAEWDAEYELLVLANDDIPDEDCTQDGASSVSAVKLVKAAQQLKDQNAALRAALKERELQLEQAYPGRRPSQALRKSLTPEQYQEILDKGTQEEIERSGDPNARLKAVKDLEGIEPLQGTKFSVV